MFENAPKWSKSLNILLEGNKRFIHNKADQRQLSDYSHINMSQGQSPIAAVVSCSDSRVPTEVVFDQTPGSLFVVRVAGNVITDTQLGSLDFAVSVLNVPLIMVLGHTGCGAVEATVNLLNQPIKKSLFSSHLLCLTDWLKQGIAQRHQSLLTNNALDDENSFFELIQCATLYSTQKIYQDSQVVQQAVKNKKVKLFSAIYDLSSGLVNNILEANSESNND